MIGIKRNSYLSILFLSILFMVIYSSGCINQPEIAIPPEKQYVVEEENVNPPETTIRPDEQIVNIDEKYFILNSFEPELEMKEDRGGIFRLNYSTDLDSFYLKVVSPDGNFNEGYLQGSFGTAWIKIPGPGIKLPGVYSVIITGEQEIESYKYEQVTFIDEKFSYKGGELSIIDFSVDDWSTTPGPSSSNPLWWIDSASIWIENSGDLPSYVKLKGTISSLHGEVNLLDDDFETTNLGWVDAGETKLFKIENEYGSADGYWWVEDELKGEYPFKLLLVSSFDEDINFYYTSENPYEIVSSQYHDFLLLDNTFPRKTLNVRESQTPWIS